MFDSLVDSTTCERETLAPIDATTELGATSATAVIR